MKKVFLLLTLVLLSGCNLRVLDPASDSAEKITDLIYLSFAIMMLVLAVVFVLFVFFIRKYKERSETSVYIPKEKKENKWLEVTWTVIPFLLLAILAVPTVKATYDITSKMSGPGQSVSKEARIIDVEAKQFRWEFTYENGKTTLNELVLPKDQKVTFHLTSTDVIHSFWIPSLAGKVDVRPNKENRLSFVPRVTGDFQGKCAEFCGTGHANMRFETKVVTQEEFENWLATE
ncbi:cytochrome c oxidase subunit II [Halobacillus shinanisalinarum]|uniref:Cytochrome c oxidase subunit 2 n=1 Tax=Halobacillus shinanisalinarum TaxID=2932258 RepID=A0ABY4H4L4_9BACI|nr:cytochrome c oxidase subunit II [Halobacillus shinanisalinarum]UOQ95040.1 cytochrome c oxidase subunit II [Halobacillus shinanisalinarum]